jgi:SAM-dependent methyltransferase
MVDAWVASWDKKRKKTLKEELKQLRTQVEQRTDLLVLERGMAPPPPDALQIRVSGGYVPAFIRSGWMSCSSFDRTLGKIDKNLGDFPSILDFGCGCGRVVRAIGKLYPGCRLYGTDIDEEAITWLQKNYGHLGAFAVSPHKPPTPFSDNQFDLIYGVSVFTHLPEDMQFEWLAELARITKPGGYLLLTTHGEKHWGRMRGEDLEVMRSYGFCYKKTRSTDGLPDFYMNSYHSHDYVRREWSRFFEIVDIEVLGHNAHQDIVLCRMPQ